MLNMLNVASKWSLPENYSKKLSSVIELLCMVGMLFVKRNKD